MDGWMVGVCVGEMGNGGRIERCVGDGGWMER